MGEIADFQSHGDRVVGVREVFHEFSSTFLMLLSKFWCCGNIIDQNFSTYGQKSSWALYKLIKVEDIKVLVELVVDLFKKYISKKSEACEKDF